MTTIQDLLQSGIIKEALAGKPVATSFLTRGQELLRRRALQGAGVGAVGGLANTLFTDPDPEVVTDPSTGMQYQRPGTSGVGRYLKNIAGGVAIGGTLGAGAGKLQHMGESAKLRDLAQTRTHRRAVLSSRTPAGHQIEGTVVPSEQTAAKPATQRPATEAVRALAQNVQNIPVPMPSTVQHGQATEAASSPRPATRALRRQMAISPETVTPGQMGQTLPSQAAASFGGGEVTVTPGAQYQMRRGWNPAVEMGGTRGLSVTQPEALTPEQRHAVPLEPTQSAGAGYTISRAPMESIMTRPRIFGARPGQQYEAISR